MPERRHEAARQAHAGVPSSRATASAYRQSARCRAWVVDVDRAVDRTGATSRASARYAGRGPSCPPHEHLDIPTLVYMYHERAPNRNRTLNPDFP